MNPLLPAALAGAAVVIAVGLPGPRRRAVLGRASSGPRSLPTAALPVGVLVFGWFALGPVGAVVAAGLSVAGRNGWCRRTRARELELERSAAAEALVVLAGELRAGRSPGVALERASVAATGPTAHALAAAASAALYGGSVAQTLQRSAPSSAVPEMLRGFAACWTVCHGTGSSLATAVDRLEEGLRAERLRRRDIETELAGPRTTALMLAVMPVFGLLLGSGMGGRPVQVLLHTPWGNGCLVVGVALDLAGLWWTARLVRAAGGTAG